MFQECLEGEGDCSGEILKKKTTLALSMTLFCHRRCHITIIDTTCNGNEMRLDQPQKGRSSDKCEAVNALGICCYFEIKSNQV
ncbi:hypothetical protein T09_5240 [Trichinella sp. T9]|nr:hypothetical protein T09_5240 [Trichinella sp. T9]